MSFESLLFFSADCRFLFNSYDNSQQIEFIENFLFQQIRDNENDMDKHKDL
jgi:hypothetical protein